MAETPLLKVEDLTVDLPTPRGTARVLDGISFDLARGESLGLAGESGCGKSMTALAIMGLLPVSARVAGRILFEGTDLLTVGEEELCRLRGRRIAMIFQEPMTALNPVKTIGDQVSEGPRLHFGLTQAAAEARAAELLDRVGLPPERFSPGLFPHQLSGGQRQRVVIAVALASDADLIIADEPTTALDVTVQAQVLDLIAGLAAEADKTLIMITHDLGVVAETTDRAMIMYAGTIAESASTPELFARMAHPYTCGLFAAIPPVPGDSDAAVRSAGRRLRPIRGQLPDPAARPTGCPFAARCPRAQPDCVVAFPPARPVGPAHLAACFYPVVPCGPAS